MSWNRLFQQHKEEPGKSDCRGLDNVLGNFLFICAKSNYFLVEKLKNNLEISGLMPQKSESSDFHSHFPQLIGLLMHEMSPQIFLMHEMSPPWDINWTGSVGCVSQQ